MKKMLVGLTVGIILLIGAGAVAYANDWLSFTGDDQVAESGEQVDEIMNILRQVNEDKITAEQALKTLQDMNPPGLVNQIKALKDEVETLEATISLRDNFIEGLELDLENEREEITDLQESNEQLVSDLNAKQTEIDNKQTEIGEKNSMIDQLQNERDELQTDKDELQTQLDNAADQEEVEHLRSELERANEKVKNHNDTTQDAVKEARTYIEE